MYNLNHGPRRTTSDPFNAIAEPRRRHILEFLAAEERSVTEIAEALELGQPSVSKHLQVLRDVGLVRVRREGRRTMYRTNAETLRTIHEWSGMFAQLLARTAAPDQGSRRGETMTTTAPVSEATFTHHRRDPRAGDAREDLRVAASRSWGGRTRRRDGKPMPMVLEPHPGGRWYRELGGDNGHLWGFVQSIKRPALLEIWGPLFMSTGATSNMHVPPDRSRRRHADHFTHTVFGPFPEDLRPDTWAPAGRRMHARVPRRAEADGGELRRYVMTMIDALLAELEQEASDHAARAGARARRPICRGSRIRSRCRSVSSRCTSRRCPGTSRNWRRGVGLPSRRRSSGSRRATSRRARPGAERQRRPGPRSCWAASTMRRWARRGG